MADAQQEQAKALLEISRSVKRLVQIFEVMNSNMVEAVRILRSEPKPLTQVAGQKYDPSIDDVESTTLGDKDKNGD